MEKGPLFGRIKKEIRTFGLPNIELKGFTSRAQLMTSMKRSKFVLIPSLYEACPMILLKSMCLGKIPVMFNLPYSLEFTENGKYGIVANSVEDMAAQIESTYMNVDMQHFGNEIRGIARTRYDVLNVASKYVDIYKELTN